MPLTATTKGLVRGQFNVPGALAENSDQRSFITPRGEQLVSIGLPGNTDLIRLAGSYYEMNATAIVPGAAIPTTTASSTLWNGELPTGKTLVVTGAYGFSFTSQAAAAFYQLIYNVSALPVAAQPATADDGVVRSFLVGKTYGGKAKVSKTVTIVDNGWKAIGPQVSTGALTATIGYSYGGQFPEPILIPPGHTISLVTLGIAAGTCALMYVWHEVQLPIAS